MTFYAHLGFSGLLKMPCMLQLLVQEFAQEKSHVNDSSVWFYRRCRKEQVTSVDIVPFCFIPQCLFRSGCCFVFRLGL